MASVTTLDVSVSVKEAVDFDAGDRVWLKHTGCGPYYVTGSPSNTVFKENEILTLVPESRVKSLHYDDWCYYSPRSLVAHRNMLTKLDPNPPAQPWREWWHENKSELVHTWECPSCRQRTSFFVARVTCTYCGHPENSGACQRLHP